MQQPGPAWAMERQQAECEPQRIEPGTLADVLIDHEIVVDFAFSNGFHVWMMDRPMTSMREALRAWIGSAPDG